MWKRPMRMNCTFQLKGWNSLWIHSHLLLHLYKLFGFLGSWQRCCASFILFIASHVSTKMPLIDNILFFFFFILSKRCRVWWDLLPLIHIRVTSYTFNLGSRISPVWICAIFINRERTSFIKGWWRHVFKSWTLTNAQC